MPRISGDTIFAVANALSSIDRAVDDSGPGGRVITPAEASDIRDAFAQASRRIDEDTSSYNDRTRDDLQGLLGEKINILQAELRPSLLPTDESQREKVKNAIRGAQSAVHTRWINWG